MNNKGLWVFDLFSTRKREGVGEYLLILFMGTTSQQVTLAEDMRLRG
jgi:hypothetical protein